MLPAIVNVNTQPSLCHYAVPLIRSRHMALYKISFALMPPWSSLPVAADGKVGVGVDFFFNLNFYFITCVL